MMFRKKSQQAIEFTIIFIFMLLIIGVLIYIFSLYAIEFKNEELKKERDSFAQMIITETEIANKVQQGYSRNVTIAEHLVERFQPNITNDYIILNDSLDLGNDNGKIYYYEFPGNVSSYSEVDLNGNSKPEGILQIQKNVTEENKNYITLT